MEALIYKASPEFFGGGGTLYTSHERRTALVRACPPNPPRGGQRWRSISGEGGAD